MYSLLLRKALPFALTFILGSLVGGLFKAVGFGGPSDGNARAFRYSYGGRHSCRMRFERRNLVAETKPLNILSKPDARLPRGAGDGRRSMEVYATFGSDGKIQDVQLGSADDWREQLDETPMWRAVEEAAYAIKFEPETYDGMPVSVVKKVEIVFKGR